MFTDIHSHILPAVDDGAVDEKTAAGMLRMACAGGTSHIIATPHFIAGAVENPSALVREKCLELQGLADREGISISIHPGAEVFISPDIPELFDKGVICTLNDSSYILLELPMSGIPVYTEDILYELQLKGLTPVIAHPERNRDIFLNPGILAGMVNRGILAQVNSGSITGLYGRKIRRAALRLIKKGLIHFVASDAHTCRLRSPLLSKAAAVVRRKFGGNTAESLFYKNGITLLENAIVPIDNKIG